MYANQWALQPPEVWDDAAAPVSPSPAVGPDGQVVSPFAAAAAADAAAGGAAAEDEEAVGLCRLNQVDT
jgi:hypothetical protein